MSPSRSASSQYERTLIAPLPAGCLRRATRSCLFPPTPDLVPTRPFSSARQIRFTAVSCRPPRGATSQANMPFRLCAQMPQNGRRKAEMRSTSSFVVLRVRTSMALA